MHVAQALQAAIRQSPLSTAYTSKCTEEKQPRSLGQTRREVLECFWALGKSRRRGPLFLILSCGHVKKKKKQPFFCCSFSWGSTTVHTNYHPYFRAGPIFFVSHCHSAIQPDRRKTTRSQSDRVSRNTEHGSHGITTTARAQ